MNSTAIIGRELRAESRRPVNYWLRVLAAAVVIAVFANLALGAPVAPPRLGMTLFAALHETLYFAFWIIVPLMTADCVSRERREGTLGLLFLTPLTVLDVVAGKAAIHVLRAVTLFLATLPVLGLPFVLGGVGVQQFIVAILYEGGAVLLGIGAGLYASANGGTAVRTMVTAEGYALGLAVVSFIVESLIGWIGHASRLGLPWFIGASIVFHLGLFSIILRAATRRLQGNWQQETTGAEQPPWVQVFSGSGFWRTAFHWDRGRTLDRNPMAWLQEYSWTARLTKWGWFLALLAIEFLVLAIWEARAFRGWQPFLTGALAAGVAFSAAGSFRRERQEGLLELLLVTPLSVRQIVLGRLWGIFCHYSPAMGVLAVGWAGEHLLNPKSYSAGFAWWILPSSVGFLSLAVLGLYLSLGRLSFLLAWLSTWAVAFLVPGLAVLVLSGSRFFESGMAFLAALAFQIVLAAGAAILLCGNLRRRAFLSVGTN